MDNSALMIFVRNPELGKVKTRLAATLGDEKALKIYKFLLEHTYDLIKNLPVKVYVFYADRITEDDLWEGNNIIKKQQQGNDLGEKMANAFTEVFEDGFSKVVIIGSDCYELTTELIIQSFDKLENSNVIIGAAKDGGYYLLGMQAPFKDVFNDIPWSTATVFRKTIKIVLEKKYSVSFLPVLNDIDAEADLNNEIKFKTGFTT